MLAAAVFITISICIFKALNFPLYLRGNTKYKVNKFKNSLNYLIQNLIQNHSTSVNNHSKKFTILSMGRWPFDQLDKLIGNLFANFLSQNVLIICTPNI